MKRWLRIFCVGILVGSVAQNTMAEEGFEEKFCTPGNPLTGEVGRCETVITGSLRSEIGDRCDEMKSFLSQDSVKEAVKNIFKNNKQKEIYSYEFVKTVLEANQKTNPNGKESLGASFIDSHSNSPEITVMLEKTARNKNYLTDKDFYNDCEAFIKKIKVNEGITNKRLSLKSYSDRREDYKKIMSSPAVYNVGMCYEALYKAGFSPSVLTECNEAGELLSGTDNKDLMELLSRLNFGGDEQFYINGDENYCGECFSNKYATHGGDQDSFEKEKEATQKKLFNELAKGKIKASLLELSSYIEKVARVLNLNNDTITAENANSYYCLEELKSLREDEGCGNQDAFNEVVRSLGICKGSDCESELKIFEGFREKVSHRGENSCADLKHLQLRDVSVVSDVKKVFDMISRLENISDTDFEEAFRELKEDDGDESDPKPFEVFARVLAKKGSLIPELKKELNEMSENFKESFDLNKKMTPEASVRLALRRAFKEFPELEFIFSDPEQLDIEFERYANGDNLKKGNFLDYINQNIANPQAALTLERIKTFRNNTCEEFKRNLRQGLCLNDQNDLSNFSSADIANTARKISLENNLNGSGIDVGKRQDIVLASLSCEIRNKMRQKKSSLAGPDDWTPTIGDNPRDYIKWPSDFAWSQAEPSELQGFDELTWLSNNCDGLDLDEGFSLEERKDQLAWRTVKGMKDFHRKNKKKNESMISDSNLQKIIKAEARNEVAYDNAVNTSLNDSYICYGGNCENSSLGNKKSFKEDTRKPQKMAVYDSVEVSSETPVATDPAPFNKAQEPLVGENLESNKPEVVNPFAGIAGASGSGSYLPQAPMPSYTPYINGGGRNNNALSQREMEERNEAIGNIAGKFPGTFSPEQLGALSNEDLQKLLAYADEKSSEEKKELEEEKLKLQKDKAAFEKEKVQAEIKRLQEEKEKLLAETRTLKNNTNNTNANTSIETPLLGAKKEVSANRYEVEKPIIANVSQVIGVDSFDKSTGGELPSESYSSGVTNLTTGNSGSSAMRGGTTGATIALLKEYKSTYYDGASDTNVSQVVDNYLNYVQSNNVSTSEIIRRNSSGELVEILIPNNKGELVSLDVSKLSPEEREKLEKKVEDLIALETKDKGQAGRKIASVSDSRVQDIDEKLSRLNNELQESYLDDLKQNILQALLNQE